MTSLAQSFAEARDNARKGGDHSAEGCGWVRTIPNQINRKDDHGNRSR